MIDRNILFAVNRLASLSLIEKIRLLNSFNTGENFKDLSRFELEWILNRKLRIRKFNIRELLEQGISDLKRTESLGISWCWYGSPSYPSILKNIYDPPFLLFWRGTLPPEAVGALAVVGTRKPALEADRSAFALGLDAARGDIPLISGLAAGIDGSAHKGVVEGGGKTWAVLGTGCDIAYPRQHRKLAAEILNKGGGLISEYIPGTGAARYNFPKRNRIISGLSDSVVIVQAPVRSGALYTADFALDQGRDVYVHESGLYGRKSGGTASLADQGATVIGALKDIYPNLTEAGHSMNESYGLASGSTGDAGRHASTMMSKELKGSLSFYKGRVQY
ncbi:MULTISPECIES: DNA-processing protein DprA [unclassified Oceanispirochaeta]|uniref:DNA-processing protein DprA n=1 Tax=unclassified Oceanispirochaeta TaxID=2635722 RepID=UPI001313F7AC|nr:MULTISPECIES: DNA-processing protein DprA [unclassified Oceanispirochaeta]MBF9016143.1 DNA-protecting protein DprA [Oceanispirochaeta sp. M2]NPD72605.1 DNA-protecting protein DprA [Oceanispirochaeta sp. M1]